MRMSRICDASASREVGLHVQVWCACEGERHAAAVKALRFDDSDPSHRRLASVGLDHAIRIVSIAGQAGSAGL